MLKFIFFLKIDSKLLSYSTDKLNNKLTKWGWHIEVIEVDGPIEVWAGAGQNDTSKGILVGHITIVGGILTLTMEPDTMLSEIHLHMGDTELPFIARGKKLVMTDAPGLFDVVLEEVNDTTWTYDIGDAEYIALHLVVGVMVEFIE